MNTVPQHGAQILPADAIRAQHLLAAANHFQWVVWQRWVIVALETRDMRMLHMLRDDPLPAELASRLEIDALASISLVRRCVCDFRQEPDVNRMVQRKEEQFRRWIAYASGTITDVSLKRWNRQINTPSLWLPRSMQVSDYRQAVTDLTLVAEISGLSLPDPLPKAEPLSLWRQLSLRTVHTFGLHGRYITMERFYETVCTGCHTENPKFQRGA